MDSLDVHPQPCVCDECWALQAACALPINPERDRVRLRYWLTEEGRRLLGPRP